jgi:hypothetical protein
MRSFAIDFTQSILKLKNRQNKHVHASTKLYNSFPEGEHEQGIIISIRFSI